MIAFYGGVRSWPGMAPIRPSPGRQASSSNENRRELPEPYFLCSPCCFSVDHQVGPDQMKDHPDLRRSRRLDRVQSSAARTTTRRPRGRATRSTRPFRRGLPLDRRVVGLRQADGTPHEPQRTRSVIRSPADREAPDQESDAWQSAALRFESALPIYISWYINGYG